MKIATGHNITNNSKLEVTKNVHFYIVTLVLNLLNVLSESKLLKLYKLTANIFIRKTEDKLNELH